MSNPIRDHITEYQNNPAMRAETEEYLEILGDTQPVRSAYMRAILRGDENAARIMGIYQDIFRLREKAKNNPIFAELLKSRIEEVKALEKSSG